MNLAELKQYGRRFRQTVSELLGAGPVHRRRLADIDVRIAVSGVRGKSTVVRWLHDVFHERGYDTYAKTTGTKPVSVYNGTETEIERPEQVRLYENEREIRKHDPDDVIIVENQGIREYTTRLVNEQFVRPDVLILTNVREDHLGTLGNEVFTIARSLARAVPSGTHVINGEQDPTIRQYLEAELQRRDATVTHVDIPKQLTDVPGIECLYALNPALRAVGEPRLTPETFEAYRRELAVAWRRLPSGRVYDAADVNDTQSTELIRRALGETENGAIEPIVVLREDRRGRTASFLRYLETLAEDGTIERAHVVGPGRQPFARRATFPVVTYAAGDDEPEEVLDSALAADSPVLIMGNTEHDFIDRIREVIDEREVGSSTPDRQPRKPRAIRKDRQGRDYPGPDRQ